MWATWWWAHVWLQVKCVSIPPPAQQMSEHGDCFQRKTCWEYRSGICLKPLAFPPLKEKTKQTSSILPSYSLSGTLMEIKLCRLTSDLTFCSLKWSSTLHLCSAWGWLVPPGESASLISLFCPWDQNVFLRELCYITSPVCTCSDRCCCSPLHNSTETNPSNIILQERAQFLSWPKSLIADAWFVLMAFLGICSLIDPLNRRV